MEFESIVDVQLNAMLEGIQQDLAARRESILAEARQQSRSRLRDARRHARQLMSQAIAEEREQWYSSLGRASAALASRLRRKQQELDRQQLATGEDQLREALLQRWNDEQCRQEWAQALLSEAAALLPPANWTVQYPASLTEGEANALLADGGDLSPEPSPDLEAGFRLRCGDAQLDMSIDGLLAQSEEIAGQLLAEIRRQQQKPGGAS